MRVLLDTHALIWAVEEPNGLGPDATVAMNDRAHEVIVSSGTIWEIAIKVSLGMLVLSQPYRAWIERAVADLGASVVPIQVAHGAVLATLPFHHRDPFRSSPGGTVPVRRPDPGPRRSDLRSLWRDSHLVKHAPPPP